MRWLIAVLVLTLSPCTPASAQRARVTVDTAAAVLSEAWDMNGAREQIAGSVVGVDFRAWRGLAVRGEALLLRVSQADADGWLRGGTLGVRSRFSGDWLRPFAEVGVGASRASCPVPPDGTSFNFIAIAGGGVEIDFRRLHVLLGARWTHLSNNGREGRRRNPDLQSIGAITGIGWTF